MKKYLFLFAVIMGMATSFIVLSCSNNEGEAMSQIAPEEVVLNNPYDFVGVLHNAAMDSVKSQKVKLCNLEDFTREYVEENFKGVKTYDDEDIPNRMMKDMKRTSYMYKSQTRSTTELDDSIKQAVPAEYEAHISKMYQLIDKYLSDTTEIDKEFCKIDYTISTDASLSNEDKHCLLAISAIAKYSYKYNSEDALTRAASFGSTAKCDLGGAIGGVLNWATFGKAAFNGLMFGPGGAVLTVAKEAARGAIIASAVCVASGGFF